MKLEDLIVEVVDDKNTPRKHNLKTQLSVLRKLEKNPSKYHLMTDSVSAFYLDDLIRRHDHNVIGYNYQAICVSLTIGKGNLCYLHFNSNKKGLYNKCISLGRASYYGILGGLHTAVNRLSFEIIESIVEYGYEDFFWNIEDLRVDLFNYLYVSKKLKHSTSKIKRKQKTYIMKDNNNGLYKIGKSVNPKHREKTLQSEKPNIKLVKVFDKDIEKKLHTIYNDQRVRGEWFELTPIQVKYICTHY